MADLDAARLEALARAVEQLGTLEYHDGETSMGTIEMSVPAPHGREFCRVSGDSGQQYANAEAIVALVNAAPALLTVAREREELRERLDEITATYDYSVEFNAKESNRLRAEVVALSTERDALLRKLNNLELELLEASFWKRTIVTER